MLHADDRWAITETLSLHGHVFDGGQLDRLEEIFTPDVIYDMSAVGLGTFDGSEMVRDRAEKMEKAGVGPLAHHVTNVVITSSEGDVATAESKILMLMKDGALQSATQVDTLRRQDDGWRISHRVISPLRPLPTRPVVLRPRSGEIDVAANQLTPDPGHLRSGLSYSAGCHPVFDEHRGL